MSPDFWHGKRVFLTGHTGFKGAWASLWLSRLGAEITGYALEPPTEPSLFRLAEISSACTSHLGDIRDLPSLAAALDASKAEIVIHMAAQSLVRASYLDPIGTYATNVMGTANVLEAARTCPSVRVVLIITTDKCYENSAANRTAFVEGDRLGGHDPYSNSKACAELVTASYRDSFFATPGAPVIATARAGNVIGGGDWARDRLVPDLMRSFMDGVEVPIRSPHAVRPWQHVLEPIAGYLGLCEQLWQDGAAFSGGWNFGPDADDAKPVSWIVERMAALWGDGAAYRIDTDAHPPEAAFLTLDTAKAAQLLGYRPRWKLPQALEATVEWYRAMAAGADMRTVTLSQIDQFMTVPVTA